MSATITPTPNIAPGDAAFISDLKARRRAELKEAENAATKAKAEADRLDRDRFGAAVKTVLIEMRLEFMMKYLKAIGDEVPDREARMVYRHAIFSIPGHRDVELVLARNADNLFWCESLGPDDEMPLPWAAHTVAGHLDYSDSLADALIAAEIDPNAPEPIPF